MSKKLKYALVQPIDYENKYGQIIDVLETEQEATEKAEKSKGELIVKEVSKWDVFDAEKMGGLIGLQ